jgi:putative membrane protein
MRIRWGMLINLIVNALAFYVTAYIVPGVRIANFQALAVVAIVWGVLSVVLKPILILLTLPVNILTLGLFTFVINAFLIMLMSNFVAGFKVDGFGTALLAAIVLALLNVVLGKLV